MRIKNSLCLGMLTAVMLLMSVNASAQEFNVGNAKYAVNPDGTSVTLVDYKKAEGAVEIPSQVSDKNGKSFTVTAIGKEAMKGSKASSVTIPSSVTTLGEKAFADSKALTSIVIPETITELPKEVFKNAKLLNSVKMPGVTVLGEGAFDKCEALTNINLPEGIIEIPFEAFHKTGLTSVTIPASVKKINPMAFYWCDNLTEFILADSPDNIDFDGAVFTYTPLKSVYVGRPYTYTGEGENKPFNNNPNLNDIHIGEYVKKVPASIITNCKNLKLIEITPELTNLAQIQNDLNGVTIRIKGLDMDFASVSEMNSYLKELEKDNKVKNAIAKFNEDHNLDDLRKVYAEFARNEDRKRTLDIMNAILDYAAAIPAKELKNDEKLFENLSDMENDYFFFEEYQKAIDCAALTYVADSKKTSGYPLALTVRCYIMLGQYEDAAKLYPKVLRLSTENGKYMVPPDVKESGEILNRNGYNVPLEYKAASKGGSSSDTFFGIVEIFHDAYKRHQADKMAEKLMREARTAQKLGITQ